MFTVFKFKIICEKTIYFSIIKFSRNFYPNLGKTGFEKSATNNLMHNQNYIQSYCA
jgi:hypothetical protein